jgi:two-component system LytT family response regulator
MSLKAIIVDDEQPARLELAMLLGAHREVHVIAEADDLTSANMIIVQLDPDVVFLDIQLGAESAFALLPSVPAHCRLVFVTAYESYAVRAFEANALDYLLKPVHPERLAATISRLTGASSGESQRPRLAATDVVFLAGGGASMFASVASIACVLADGDYTRVITHDGRERLILRSLQDWEQRLPAEMFARVHRSAIVNLRTVDRVVPVHGGRMRLYIRALAQPVTVSRRLAKRLRAMGKGDA